MNFINLTSGIEWMPDVHPPFHFLRIQSTHLEQAHLDSFVMSLSDELLLRLAGGGPCLILDCGSRRASGVSRTIWQGVPLAKAILTRAWMVGSLTGVDPYASHAYAMLKESTRTRLKYYRKFLRPGLDLIRLDGVSKPAKHDGNYGKLTEIYYRELARTSGVANELDPSVTKNANAVSTGTGKPFVSAHDVEDGIGWIGALA